MPVYEGEFREFCPICVRDSSPKLNRDCFRWQSPLFCHTSISQFYLNFCLPNNLSHCEVLIIPSSSRCWSLFESWNQYKIFIVCFSTLLFSRKQGIEMIQVRYPYGIFLSFLWLFHDTKGCSLMCGCFHNIITLYLSASARNITNMPFIKWKCSYYAWGHLNSKCCHQSIVYYYCITQLITFACSCNCALWGLYCIIINALFNRAGVAYCNAILFMFILLLYELSCGFFYFAIE